MSGRYRYAVHEHRFGRPGVKLPNGQVWETDLAGHKWVCASSHTRRADAIAAAADSPTHAVVIEGKPPGKEIFNNRKPALDRVANG